MVTSNSLTSTNLTNTASNTNISQAKKEALKEYNSLFIKDEEVLNLATDIDLNLASSSLSKYVVFDLLNSPSHKAATASAVNNSAKSIANSNSAISSQQQIINLTNEAAINARMVYLKNPYKSDEEKMGNMAYDEA